MWWKKKEAKKDERKAVIEPKEEESLLKELCGDDTKLCDLLSNYLALNPLTAISKKDLDILIEEAEKSGDFRPAMDKAIFESAQKPEERERYIKIIQNLTSKTIHATEREKEKVGKEGLLDRAASLGRRIEEQRFISDRTVDIIKVASEFYKERLLELEQDEEREARGKERERAKSDEWSIKRTEEAKREARRKEERKMGKEERREAEKQDKIEELEAEARKEARAEEKRKAEIEEERIRETEKEGREERKKERGGN
jgi:hypothetical protein